MSLTAVQQFYVHVAQCVLAIMVVMALIVWAEDRIGELFRRAMAGDGDTVPASELATEAEIQAKGLNAPRLTPALIDGQIEGEAFHVFPGTTLTVCA